MKKQNNSKGCEILFTKSEMIKELKQKCGEEVTKGMRNWKTSDVRDVWNELKSQELKFIIKNCQNNSKEICANCEYYEPNFNGNEVCAYETLVNSGCPEELPKERNCKKFIPQNNSKSLKTKSSEGSDTSIEVVETQINSSGDFKLSDKAIEFISTFEYYNLEKTIKNYTIRKLTPRLKKKLVNVTHVRIRKGYTSESFTRKVLLVFYWEDFVIISWRLEDLK